MFCNKDLGQGKDLVTDVLARTGERRVRLDADYLPLQAGSCRDKGIVALLVRVILIHRMLLRRQRDLEVLVNARFPFRLCLLQVPVSIPAHECIRSPASKEAPGGRRGRHRTGSLVISGARFLFHGGRTFIRKDKVEYRASDQRVGLFVGSSHAPLRRFHRQDRSSQGEQDGKVTNSQFF